MNFMETFLDSKLNPFVALAKRGSLKGFVNKFNGEAELLDDLVSAFIVAMLSLFLSTYKE